MSQSLASAAPPPTEPPSASGRRGHRGQEDRGPQPVAARPGAPAARPGRDDLPGRDHTHRPAGDLRAGDRRHHRPRPERAVRGDRADGHRPAEGAELDVPARDGQPGSRRPGPDRLRGPDFADRRDRGHRSHGHHRCGRRAGIRVLRRPDRLADRPVHRLAAGHPVPAVRHLPGGGHRAQPDRRHPRHRLLRLGVGRPYRPRPGPVDQGEGVRRGGAGRWGPAPGGSCSSTFCRTCWRRSSSTRRC